MKFAHNFKFLLTSLFLGLTVQAQSSYPLLRQPYKFETLESIVGTKMATSISNATLNSNIGTWTVLLREHAYILTAGHVSAVNFGTNAATRMPLDSESILNLPSMMLSRSQNSKADGVSLNVNAVPIVSPTNEKYAPGDDIFLGLVLPDQVSEANRKMSAGQGGNGYPKISRFDQYSPELMTTIENQGNAPIDISSDTSVGTEVFAVGYPKRLGLSISTGKIVPPSSMSLDKSDAASAFNPEVEFIVNMVATEGNSGSAVYNRQGRLLGIMVRANASLTSATQAALPTDYVRVVKIDYILKRASANISNISSDQRPDSVLMPTDFKSDFFGSAQSR